MMTFTNVPQVFEDALLSEIGNDAATGEPIQIMIHETNIRSFVGYAFSRGAAAAIQQESSGHVHICLKQLPKGAPQIQFNLAPIVIAIRNRELFHRGKGPWPETEKMLVDLHGPPDVLEWRYIARQGQLLNDRHAKSATHIPLAEIIEIVRTELSKQLENARPF
jgi:hypothetical protein